MTRHASANEQAITEELDQGSLSGLLDLEEWEPRPTTVMRRDELLVLVNATAAVAVSAHAVPRVLLDLSLRDAARSGAAGPFDHGDDDLADVDLSTVSPTIVLALICVLIAVFVAIVMTA